MVLFTSGDGVLALHSDLVDDIPCRPVSQILSKREKLGESTGARKLNRKSMSRFDQKYAIRGSQEGNNSHRSGGSSNEKLQFRQSANSFRKKKLYPYEHRSLTSMG